MTKKWSNRIVFAGAFAIIVFSLPIVSRGADQRNASETFLTNPNPVARWIQTYKKGSNRLIMTSRR